MIIQPVLTTKLTFQQLITPLIKVKCCTTLLLALTGQPRFI